MQNTEGERGPKWPRILQSHQAVERPWADAKTASGLGLDFSKVIGLSTPPLRTYVEAGRVNGVGGGEKNRPEKEGGTGDPQQGRGPNWKNIEYLPREKL